MMMTMPHAVDLIWSPKNVSHEVFKFHFVEVVDESRKRQEVHGRFSS